MKRPELLTLPNALTLARALGVPLFIYLALVLEADGWAILTLAIGGATDYFDGKIARAWGQESRFGELADPAIDRIYIVATLIVLYLRDAIPLWVILILLARDAVLALVTIALTANSLPPLKVTYLGKAATFNLLYAFPFLLLALNSGVDGNWYSELAYIFGWSFALWGIALYFFTGVNYLRVALSSIKNSR